MNRNKVIIDAQMLARENTTGMGRYIQELLAFLTKNSDFEWIVKQPKPIKFYRTLWEHTILPLYSVIERANILFCPSNIAPLFVPKKVKLIVTIHDLRVKKFPDTFSKSTRIYYNLNYLNTFNRADAIITVSEFSKNEIIKYYPQAKEKIFVIPNGINLQQFRVLNIPRKKQILFIGAIAKHKNIKIILKAFLTIKDKIDHTVVIVGSKDSGMPEDEETKEILKQIPPERVIFTGKLTDEEIVRVYNESEIFVFPSIYEGFGLPILEAMACGCPVIASNQSSIPEVCGDSALLFDPFNPEELAEKILLLTNDSNLRNKLVEKGLERVKVFSWEKAAEKHIEVFKRVMYGTPA